MGAKLSLWWQRIKQHAVATALISLSALLVVLVLLGGYQFHWGWTGFNGSNKSGKALWDWMQLLIIPFALAIIAIFFNRSERKNEQRIARDNQQEAALQEYIKEMSVLLLEKNLRKSDLDDEVRKIARVRTLSVLLRLDKERKTNILEFLFASHLIDKDECIVVLYGADLSRANLFGAILYKADLRGATLIEVNLGGAFLCGANLEGANLNRAILSVYKMNDADLSSAFLFTASPASLVQHRQGKAYLSGYIAGMSDGGTTNLVEANLKRAKLIEADLCRADLTKADLHSAFLVKANLQYAQLNEANLSAAILIETNLREANLHKADLSEAKLFGANLIGANLKGAIVTQEQLNEATSLKGAIMPDGSVHP